MFSSCFQVGFIGAVKTEQAQAAPDIGRAMNGAFGGAGFGYKNIVGVGSNGMDPGVRMMKEAPSVMAFGCLASGIFLGNDNGSLIVMGEGGYDLQVLAF